MPSRPQPGWVGPFEVDLRGFGTRFYEAFRLGFEPCDLLICEPANVEDLKSWVSGFPDAARLGGMSHWTKVEVTGDGCNGDDMSRHTRFPCGRGWVIAWATGKGSRRTDKRNRWSHKVT